jgi:hypothetical protein
MRIVVLSALCLLSSFIFVPRARLQSADELRAKYGAPLEAYEVRPHILMTVKYSEDGRASEYVIEARHNSQGKMDAESLMSGAMAREIVDEVVPPSQRGQRQNILSFNSSCNVYSLEKYERVEIRTFATCPSGGGKAVASVIIRRK